MSLIGYGLKLKRLSASIMSSLVRMAGEKVEHLPISLCQKMKLLASCTLITYNTDNTKRKRELSTKKRKKMAKQCILRMAKTISSGKEKVSHALKTMLGASICPTCGEDLILQSEELTTKEKRELISKKEIDVPHKRDY